MRSTEKANTTIEAEVKGSTDTHIDEDDDEDNHDDGEHDDTKEVIEQTSKNTETKNAAWTKLKDSRGNTYYYNPKTNKTSWTIPTEKEENHEDEDKNISAANANWKEASDQYGRKYYYNVQTNETSWSLPSTLTTQQQQQKQEFIPSQKFTVARQGYFFCLGHMGLGYYLDK